MKLKIGPTRRFRANNTRGAAFHGMGAFVGTGKLQHDDEMHAAASEALGALRNILVRIDTGKGSISRRA